MITDYDKPVLKKYIIKYQGLPADIQMKLPPYDHWWSAQDTGAILIRSRFGAKVEFESYDHYLMFLIKFSA